MYTFQGSRIYSSYFDPSDFILFTYKVKSLALSFLHQAAQQSSPGLFVSRDSYHYSRINESELQRWFPQIRIFNSPSDFDVHLGLGPTSQDKYCSHFFFLKQDWCLEVYTYFFDLMAINHFYPCIYIYFLLHLFCTGSIGVLIKSFNNKTRIENMVYGTTQCIFIRYYVSVMHLNEIQYFKTFCTNLTDHL